MFTSSALCTTHDKNAELHLCLCHIQFKFVETKRQNFIHSPVTGCLVGYLSHMMDVCVYVFMYVRYVCMYVYMGVKLED
jgi:hypothetical protein